MKKLLLAALVACAPLAAFAQTYPSPTFQSLNLNTPLSVTSGGTGSSTGITYSLLPSLSANQLLGSLTATTPSGLTVPSCSASSNALTWTPGAGFGCNTISTSGTPGGSSSAIQYNNSGAFAGATGVTIAGSSQINLGVAGTTAGALVFSNATSGTVTLAPPTGALGAVTVTLPLGGTLLNSTTGATAGANSNITSLSGLATPLSAAQGGTGATSLGVANTAWFGTLPTSLPAASGVLWNNGGLLSRS